MNRSGLIAALLIGFIVFPSAQADAEGRKVVFDFSKFFSSGKDSQKWESSQKNETLSRIRIFKNLKSKSVELSKGERSRSLSFTRADEGVRWEFASATEDPELRTWKWPWNREKKYFSNGRDHTVGKRDFRFFTKGIDKPVGMFIPGRYAIPSGNQTVKIELMRLDLGLENIREKDISAVRDDLKLKRGNGFRVSKWVRSVEGHVNPGNKLTSIFKWLDRERRLVVQDSLKSEDGSFIDAEVVLGTAWDEIILNHDPEENAKLEYYKVWKRNIKNRTGQLGNFQYASISEKKAVELEHSKVKAAAIIDQEAKYFAGRVSVLRILVERGEGLLQSRKFQFKEGEIRSLISETKKEIADEAEIALDRNLKLYRIAGRPENSFLVPDWVVFPDLKIVVN